MIHDTDPPSAPPTTPNLPDDIVIEHGHAQEAVLMAIDTAMQAFFALEAVAMACARQLDTDTKGVTT